MNQPEGDSGNNRTGKAEGDLQINNNNQLQRVINREQFNGNKNIGGISNEEAEKIGEGIVGNIPKNFCNIL